MRGIIRGLAVLLVLLAALSGAAAETDAPVALEITDRCKFKTSNGGAGALTDGSYRSEWTYEGSTASMAVAIPDNGAPGALIIYWTFEPTNYELVEYDAGQNVLRTRDQSCTFPSIVSLYELLPETRYVFVNLKAAEQNISEVKVYTQGALPERVQQWRAPVEKADLMVVSAHQDDELIFFGGTIPRYAVAEQRPTVVVYMANCTRSRRQEALNGLWAMGVRDYPEFINLRDKRVESVQAGIELWGGQEAILSELVQRIRRFRPEVIVTHDFNGEYGHNQHKITAMAMQYAIDAAADPAQFPESASAYGAWQVKKLYIHLYGENQIYMDWNTPLEGLGGLSPLQSAQLGYAEHVSQQDYYQVVDGGKYDNAKFGLYSTQVGLDTGKNDFFENIDTASAVTPEPTASPEPAAVPEPTDAPVETPAATLPPVEQTAKHGGNGWMIGAGIAALAAAGGCAALLLRSGGRRRRRHRRR